MSSVRWIAPFHINKKIPRREWEGYNISTRLYNTMARILEMRVIASQISEIMIED